MFRQKSALIILSIIISIASCKVDEEAGLDGSVDDPIEISTEAHRGIVGYSSDEDSSYYTFVSPSPHPTIHFDNRTYADDLDCYVYSDSDFEDVVGQNELTNVGESTLELFLVDCTNKRLFVKIYNYDHDHVVEYDIYYTP